MVGDTEVPIFGETTDGDRCPSGVVRGFDVDAFSEWEPWLRLRRLLHSGNGAYGVAGPRGAGKTWLMQRARQFAIEGRGIGLWFPSPSEYDSVAFLAALSERFAEAIEERRQVRNPILAFATLGPGFFVSGGFFFAVVGAFYGQLFFSSLAATVLGAAVGLAGGVAYLALLRLLRASRPSGRLLLYARDLKQRVRFSLTRTEGMDIGASVGGTVAAKLGLSRRDELAERPVTLSSLVHEFRRLATLAGEAVEGPVVIAIDELDKIDDEDAVRRLLRDIKGIFGVPGVHFLVSVSHEAARSLNLNGLTERNEFNSSFDVVLELEPVQVQSLVELLGDRDWSTPDPTGVRAVAVLAGGIPREAIRLAELVLTRCEKEGRRLAEMQLPEIVSAAVAPEAEELRRVIVTAGSNEVGTIGQGARLGCFESLSEYRLSPTGLRFEISAFVRDVWDPPWGSDSVWSQRFLEEWRRLLVRLYVSHILITRPGIDPNALQGVVYASTQSAAVAMLILAGIIQLRGEEADFARS